MTKKQMKKIIRRISLYPPYLGAGIRIISVNEDYTRLEVQMKLKWYNKNLFGTHFGGSLYAMSDPFFVFIIFHYLGNGYIVWDKSAKINFLKPGKGTVKTVFELSEDELKNIKTLTDEKGKSTFFLNSYVLNEKGEKVASIEKEIYVRKKEKPSK